MNATLKSMLCVAGLVLATQAAAEVTFFERPGFGGQSFVADRPLNNFNRIGFNDRASSAIVKGGRWEVCEHANFGGQCVVLRPGRYDSLAQMGMNNRVSSVRPAGGAAHAAPPPPVAPVYDYRRRKNEKLFVANVTSVHAVVGPPEQRCWIEREQVQTHGGPNVPGAIAGAVIGGIIGHQIGGGRGQDVATAGGAVGGAAIGANVGRGGGGVYTQNVQRCTTVSSQRPEFWDVTYYFRGQEHRMQMTTPPGRTILVNKDGEPRV